MPTAVLERGSRKVDRKVLSISSKRQITIPQRFSYWRSGKKGAGIRR